MFGWLKGKKKAGPEAQAPALGSGRGWIDADGIFWFKANPKDELRAKDVFLIDDLMVKHGGTNWYEPFTVLATAEIAKDTFGDKALEMRKKAILDMASLARKVFNLEPLDDSGKGTTEAEAALIISDYVLWVGKVMRDHLPLSKLPA